MSAEKSPSGVENVRDSFLPMPHRKNARRCGAKEKSLYAKRWRAHCKHHQDYEAKFNRPPRAIFQKAWLLVEPWLPKEIEVVKSKRQTLLPLEPSDEEKVALIVLIDLLINAAQIGRGVTYNEVFDEICRKYSDHFIASPARRCRDMTPKTVKNARRDLLCNNIDINKLWILLRGIRLEGDQFFSVSHSEVVTSTRPLRVTLVPSSNVHAFINVVNSSPQSFSSRSARVRLAFLDSKRANEKRQIQETAEYCVETPYNVIKLGQRSIEVIDLQSRVELLFDIHAFKSDMRALKVEERKLRRHMLNKYEFDPRMPKHKGRSFAKSGPAGEWKKIEMWSERDRYIYCRSIAEGFEGNIFGDEVTAILNTKKETIAGEKDEDKRAKLEAKESHRYTSFALWLIDSAATRVSSDQANKDESLAVAYRQQTQLDRLVARLLPGVKHVYAERAKHYAEQGEENDSLSQAANWARRQKQETFQSGLNYLESLLALPRASKELAFTPESVARAAIVGQEWRQKVYVDIARYDEVRELIRLFSAVEAQVRRRSGVASIHCGFVRSINRRYQPVDMWPTYVGDWNLLDGPNSGKASTYRKQWFKGRDPFGQPCQLVGLDISSSQTQIIAALFGSEELEALTMDSSDSKPSFKQTLATWAFEMDQDPNNEFEFRPVKKGTGVAHYTGGDDGRLQELCKSLWMKVSYGSNPYVIAIEQAADRATYGPGWTVDNAKKFLDFLQAKFPDAVMFLEACQAIGKRVAEEKISEGCVFIDPSDDTEVQWNPIKRKDLPIKSDGHTLIVSIPANRTRRSRFTPGYAARYRLDVSELGKMIAPCLIHMLDAYYSTLVMKKLAACGITEFVGIHDCWLVPETVMVDGNIEKGLVALRKALKEAAAEWYRGLGPIYKRLHYYLSKEDKYRPWIENAEARWTERKNAGYAPVFATKVD